MITKFADLLRQLQETQVEILREQDVTHPPTIGEMYEGAAADLLDRSIPPIADLRVVRGFVRDMDGNLSPEVDCMLVRGPGTPVPMTRKFIIPVKDVLCTFEVKKTLNPEELFDAVKKTGVIGTMALRYHTAHRTPFNWEKIATSFALMTGTFVGNLKMHGALAEGDRQIFTLLSEEFLSPLRVVYSYGGYKTELGLRKAFVDLLEKKGAGTIGFHSIPNLVVCKEFSLLKSTGNPYCLSANDGRWPLMVSNCENPVRILLELLWDKISSLTQQSMYFSDDLEQEHLKPLIMVRWAADRKPPGFAFSEIDYDAKDLRGYKRKPPWAPSEIDHFEAVELMQLNQSGPHAKDSGEFVEYCKRAGVSPQDVIAKLVEKRLIAENGNVVYPVHDPIHITFSPDGRTWASFDQSLLSTWIEKQPSGVRSA
jgi:hypothetical protein